MEDDLKKMNKMEDDLQKMEDDLNKNGRRPQTKIEDNFGKKKKNGRRP